jgi:hypothetical protein
MLRKLAFVLSGVPQGVKQLQSTALAAMALLVTQG